MNKSILGIVDASQPIESIISVGGISLLGTVFDFLSLIVSFILLKKAAYAVSLFRTLRHLLIDCVIMYIALAWATTSILSVLRPSRMRLSWRFFIAFIFLPLEVIFDAFTVFHTLIMPGLTIPELFEGRAIDAHAEWAIKSVTERWITAIVLSISVAFPTMGYALIIVVATAARFTPKVVQRFITKCIFLVTTDDKPVLSQLGTVAGAIAAVLAAVVAALAAA